MITIKKEAAPVWWRFLKSSLYPGALEMFAALAAHCEEGCESCHLILCKELKGPE